MNRLAWALVDPEGDASIHDPVEALPHARKAVELTKRKDLNILDTLAVALAANREFEEAIAVQEELLQLMNGTDVSSMKLIDARAALERYRSARATLHDPEAAEEKR